MNIALFQYFQLFSLLVAIVCYKGLLHHRLVLFIPLLLLTNVIELIGNNYRALGWAHNYAVYNLYILLVTPLHLYLYGNMLTLKKNERPVYLSICALSMLLLLLNYIFLQGPNQFNNISVVLIEILNIVFSCFILLRLAFRGDLIISIFKEPYFWVSAANLLFGLITLVLLGLQQYIRSNHVVIGSTSLYHYLLPVVNIILYSCYCLAFILCRTRTNRSLSSSLR